MHTSRPESFAILGYGHFGRALAGLLQQTGYAVSVFDPHVPVPATLAVTSLAAAATSDWIVLAMPVSGMRPALQKLRPLLGAQQTVLDVGSVKQLPCRWMDQSLGATIPRAGTHPLFGPISLARDEHPRRVVLCASVRHPVAATRTRALFTTLGCEVIERNPAEHDRTMARTHALTFFIARALTDMGVGEDLSLAPPSFRRLSETLAAVHGDAEHLFAAIERENPYAAAARSELLEHLASIHWSLESGDAEPLTITDDTRAAV